MAISFNYLVAFIIGILLHEKDEKSFDYILHQPWLFNAVLIGVSFIILFYLIALTAQKITISVATISNKMSMIIPVGAGVFLYNEHIGILKIAGILSAIGGVYFASLKEGALSIDKRYLKLPFLVFVGNGCIDAYLKYTQTYSLNVDSDLNLFLSVLFAVAFLAGIVYNMATWSKLQKNQIIRSIIWGMILGLPNYGSIYFLLKTLDYSNLESSVIFPVNNISIVLASAFVSLLFFKEQFNTKNKIGILLSIIAIVLIAL